MANFEVDTDTDSEPDSDICASATFNRVNTPQIETVF